MMDGETPTWWERNREWGIAVSVGALILVVMALGVWRFGPWVRSPQAGPPAQVDPGADSAEAVSPGRPRAPDLPAQAAAPARAPAEGTTDCAAVIGPEGASLNNVGDRHTAGIGEWFDVILICRNYPGDPAAGAAMLELVAGTTRHPSALDYLPPPPDMNTGGLAVWVGRYRVYEPGDYRVDVALDGAPVGQLTLTVQ